MRTPPAAPPGAEDPGQAIAAARKARGLTQDELARRAAMLLTHAATLFTIFEADTGAAVLRDPSRLVTGLISRELLREQLPTDTFGNLDPGSVTLAKTADRSVLGCMNDMAFMCETATTRSGGLGTTDIADLNQALRRNINSARDYQMPIELTARRLPARASDDRR